MNTYKTGLQLHSDKPEHILQITAKDSDEAWFIAANKYRREYDMSNEDLITMVLWDEQKIINK